MIKFSPFHFSANLVTNPNDECSQLSFDEYYVSVPRKLTILELGSKKSELSYFKLSYLFWEHKDSVGRGNTVQNNTKKPSPLTKKLMYEIAEIFWSVF